MGDVIRNFTQARHQLANAFEHGVEALRQPVHFIIGSRHCQPPRKVSRHDGTRCLGHLVHAPKYTASHEDAPCNRKA